MIMLTTFSPDILKMRTKNVELKENVIKKLTDFGSFEYTLNTMRGLETKLLALIESAGGNPFLIKLLDSVKEI